MKRLIELHPDLSLRGGRRKNLEIITLVAWYTAGEQNGMGLRIIRDELYHLLMVGKRQSVGWKMSSVTVNSTGEPVLQQMCLEGLTPLLGDGVEETEHLPTDPLSKVQENAVGPLPCLYVVTLPTCCNSSMSMAEQPTYFNSSPNGVHRVGSCI